MIKLKILLIIFFSVLISIFFLLFRLNYFNNFLDQSYLLTNEETRIADLRDIPGFPRKTIENVTLHNISKNRNGYTVNLSYLINDKPVVIKVSTPVFVDVDGRNLEEEFLSQKQILLKSAMIGTISSEDFKVNSVCTEKLYKDVVDKCRSFFDNIKMSKSVFPDLTVSGDYSDKLILVAVYQKL